MIEGQTQSQTAGAKGNTTRRALLFAAGAMGLMATGFSRRVNALSTKETKPKEKMLKNGTYTTSDGVKIYYKDWGKGPVVVFSHGWPLSADAWDAQMLFLGKKGYRVIAHDRRGHGRSSQPWTS
jgi:non-heme chloroperoxidase